MLTNQEIEFISGLDTAHCDIGDEFEAYLPRAFPDRRVTRLLMIKVKADEVVVKSRHTSVEHLFINLDELIAGVPQGYTEILNLPVKLRND